MYGQNPYGQNPYGQNPYGARPPAGPPGGPQQQYWQQPQPQQSPAYFQASGPSGPPGQHVNQGAYPPGSGQVASSVVLQGVEKAPENKDSMGEDEEHHGAHEVGYAGISCTTGLSGGFWQFFNDVRYAHRHFQRANENSELLLNIASPAEQRKLHDDMGVCQRVLINMMVWRRSTMKVLFCTMFVTTLIGIQQAAYNLVEAINAKNKQPMIAIFAEWQVEKVDRNLPAEFQDYSWAVIREVQRLLMAEALICQSTEFVIVAMFQLLALGLVSAAMWSWTHFARSRKLMLSAWAVSAVAPFTVSLVPTRLFVDWNAPESLLVTYEHELEVHLGLDNRFQQLQRVCKALKTDGAQNVAKAVSSFNTICGFIDHLPADKVTIPTSWKLWKWTKVDTGSAHSACAQGRDMINRGQPLQTLRQAQAACAAMDEAMKEWDEDYGNAPQMVSYFTERVKSTAEAAMSLLLALENLGAMLPVALSIAPGFLKGALRIKMVVPQSIVPGMFIIILPWLYSPISWCIYCLCFQMIGSTTLCLGLMGLSFSPIVYFTLGRYYQLDKPMSDTEVTRVMSKITRAVTLTYCLSGVFLVTFFVNIVWTYAAKQKYWGLWGGEPPKDDWGVSAEGEFLVRIYYENWETFVSSATGKAAAGICSVLTSYYLTGAAGVDWMVGKMAEFHEREKRLKFTPVGLSSTETMVKEYEARMDELLALSGVENWMEIPGAMKGLQGAVKGVTKAIPSALKPAKKPK